jgi:hypothetical protein
MRSLRFETMSSKRFMLVSLMICAIVGGHHVLSLAVGGNTEKA